MDAAIISRTFFPHTRGLAIGDGRVYLGQADGHLVALDENTGEVIWDKQLVDSAKETAGFSGAGTFVSSDLFVIGQNGGEYPVEGKIFGVDPKTGDLKWTFYTTGRDDPQALATWGGDSWKYGGGGSWQPGTVDYENNQILIGTGNPNPDYDFCGSGLPRRERQCPPARRQSVHLLDGRARPRYRQAELVLPGSAERPLRLRRRARRIHHLNDATTTGVWSCIRARTASTTCMSERAASRSRSTRT